MVRGNDIALGILAVCLTLTACGTATSSDQPSEPNTTTQSQTAQGFAAMPTDRNHVVRIIDGDTFVTDNNVHVRVLGINSCEKNTKGGSRATAEAHQLLDNQLVKLTAEPGHDTDRYGRALRYVRLADGRDYASVMVAADHTYVYQGRNDANASYVANLRTLDGNGRNCDI